jgi:uncharacterized membrane protein
MDFGKKVLMEVLQMNNELNYLIGIMGLSWLIVILAVSFTPYFIRKNISFGISVPENEYHDPHLKALRHIYTFGCLVVGLILAATSSFSYVLINADNTMWIQLASIFLYLFLSLIFYFYVRTKVKSIKRESKWQVDSKAVAEISDKTARNTNLHTAWYLLYLVVIAITILAAVFKYPSLPEQIPMHYTIAGEVDRYAQKSIGTFTIMPVIQLLIGVLFAGINVAISTSKRQKDFKKGNAFRGVLSVILFATGFMVMLLLTCVQLVMVTALSEKLISVLPVAFLIATFVIFAYLAVRIGQGGSRLKGTDDDQINLVDDDSLWIGGFFYYNKNDPSIFVEKRFGIGYTLNYGNPISILAIMALLLLIAALLILPLIIK